jgi:hypothetical protein
LDGFGHLPQYTAVQAALRFSNWRDVPNRFARFKFSAKHVLEEEPGRQAIHEDFK